ncbi:hypothetical protein OE88DRAFT_262278 [Heliocybe sulcata]|uniref:Uncharacterized protein n=1 Tax=Heliocybe sulcata TaxID=5364 RepID=A0A5C3N9I4_9AGAM|nr:hypothetical protein OE88DRAFT_262278 [Heliocybe sulcata]
MACGGSYGSLAFVIAISSRILGMDVLSESWAIALLATTSRLWQVGVGLDREEREGWWPCPTCIIEACNDNDRPQMPCYANLGWLGTALFWLASVHAFQIPRSRTSDVLHASPSSKLLRECPSYQDSNSTYISACLPSEMDSFDFSRMGA